MYDKRVLVLLLCHRIPPPIKQNNQTYRINNQKIPEENPSSEVGQDPLVMARH